jgi:formate hydrogenlyase subunit 6/NADH:ubiquinone oxidoreductase subunit I
MMAVPSGKPVAIAVEQLPQLIAAIANHGYELFGPTVGEDAIVYGRLNSVEDLPRGWKDEQQSGKYRLVRRDDEAFFGHNVGPQSWKKFLHAPIRRLWTCTYEGGGFRFILDSPAPVKRAFIGVRACELHAIAILDKVLASGACVDPEYKAARENLLIVAVNCGQASGTCFCASMNSGPKATAGFDLALTEILESGKHYFVAEIGTRRGAEIAAEIPHRGADGKDRELADQVIADTRKQMGRTLDVSGLKDLLYRNYENPRWESVANRCLTCANCTMVCPTCFCTTVEDVADLTGQRAERWRKWDSCFAMDFSYIHGGSVRSSAKSRYRQWVTHKLAAWVDQFGEFGCVGCGRCITWCPTGIDITEEVRAIRDSETAAANGNRKEAGWSTHLRR